MMDGIIEIYYVGFYVRLDSELLFCDILLFCYCEKFYIFRVDLVVYMIIFQFLIIWYLFYFLEFNDIYLCLDGF